MTNHLYDLHPKNNTVASVLQFKKSSYFQKKKYTETRVIWITSNITFLKVYSTSLYWKKYYNNCDSDVIQISCTEAIAYNVVIGVNVQLSFPKFTCTDTCRGRVHNKSKKILKKDRYAGEYHELSR